MQFRFLLTIYFLQINIEQYSDVKSNTNEEKKAVDEDGVNNRATSGEGGEDLTMKSKLFEILKKATNNCDAEKLSYKWQEMVVNKVEDEFKKYRALGDEELRKAKGGCEEEFKKKLKIKEDELEAKHDEERRKWEKERKILKEKYEMMRWTQAGYREYFMPNLTHNILFLPQCSRKSCVMADFYSIVSPSHIN